MQRFLLRFRVALDRRGGFLGSFARARRVFRREGIRGVLIRLRQVTADLFRRRDHQQAYRDWMQEFFPSSPERLDQMRACMERWVYRPVISVIMPVYNPKMEWLEQAIGSVRCQLYAEWELCIADDASTDPRVRESLARAAAQDRRVKVVYRNQNGHIAAATNSAIALASGQYLGFLDQDDLLTIDALFWIVERLQAPPRPRMLFSDEDKVSDSNDFFSPYFKCDLNRELLLSQNMVTHFAVYEAELIRQLGGCRLGFDGSQDYDLMLRVVDAVDESLISHIPRVLYHWRVHDASTARDAQAKPYALLAAKKAIEQHLQRNAETAMVSVDPQWGVSRVRFALPEPAPLVSILVPTRNRLTLLMTCVESLMQLTDYPSYEIIIIDNGSDDPKTLSYLEQLAARSRVRMLRDDRPFNFSALNNHAAQVARGEILVLLNNDTEIIDSQWLAILVSHATRKGVGVVGAKLIYPDQRVQHAGVVLGIGDCAGHLHQGLAAQDMGYFSRAALTQNFSAVTAACLAVRRDLFLKVGGLNEDRLAVAFNDIDFCLKVSEQGFRNVWAADCVLVHHESASRGFEDTAEKMHRFRHEVAFMQMRWQHILWNDACYSPNLTLEGLHCQLAVPPRVPPLPLQAPVASASGERLRYGVVIPTQNAGQLWERVLASLKMQTGLEFSVFIVDSGSQDDTLMLSRLSGYEPQTISPESFTHGGTRQRVLEMTGCDIVFFLTQDSVLATPFSLLELARAFDDPRVGLAYGRQLARSGAKISARVLRQFNYPSKSEVRSLDDRVRLGIRCAFNSNSFAAYRVSALMEIGGFDREAPVGEDVLACAALLEAGFKCAYVSSAYAIHSHDYSLRQEFSRYRLIGRMHALRPQLLRVFGEPRGEGVRLVCAELREAWQAAPWLMFAVIIRAAVKYLGYRAGRMQAL